ncbi:hypothetical protein FHS82_001057 [Pseudochelatococcus lubricantis]|uniref:Uncharacterized protein n=1 Tax=Pseudochelatococcus lubricantis TaxID=1538102 RepID=A0ABX0V2E0_9HYPH|nr:hypothetical protein [Pseudochelatococcus lubricantis]NIJ57231.1 hypothetical protein [Pseudochelatococcus lubricantis]
MSFDLSSIDALTATQEDGVEVHIVHPATGEDTGIVIRVAGPDSQRRRVVQKRVTDQRLKRRRNKPLTSDELEDEALRVAAGATISWAGVRDNGVDLEFSTDAAIALYRKHRWVYEQVEADGNDRAAFLKS